MRKKSAGGPKISQDAHQKPRLKDQDDDACNDDTGKTLPDSSAKMRSDAGDLRQCGRKHEKMFGGDCEVTDLLDREICLGCNQRGDVLVCSGKDCPVSLHEKCVGCGPKYDSLGNFYCPYCWYKLLVVEARELRKKAELVRKHLSNFLNLRFSFGSQTTQKDKVSEIQNQDRAMPKENGGSITSDINHVSERFQDEATHAKKNLQNERNSSERTNEGQQKSGVGGGKQKNAALHNADNFMHCSMNTSVCIEMEQNFISNDELNEMNKSKANRSESAEDGDDLEQNPGNRPESERQTDFDGVVKAEPLAAYYLGEDQCVHSLYCLLDEGKNGTVSGEGQCMKEGGKQITQEIIVPGNFNNGDSPIDHHIDNLPQTRKLAKRTAQIKIRRCDQNKERTRSGESSPSTSDRSVKRKRLNWSAEEEEKLREGVPKFTSANRNIPWRKILEYGCSVFDTSRTPVDLKDKWRNMMAKENPSLDEIM